MYAVPEVLSVTSKPAGKKSKVTVVTTVGTFTRTTARPYRAIAVYGSQNEQMLAREIKGRQNTVDINREYYTREIAAKGPDAPHSEYCNDGVTLAQAWQRTLDAAAEAVTPEFAENYLADHRAGKYSGYVTWHHSVALAQKGAASCFNVKACALHAVVLALPLPE
jgi:hypothetical protein